MGQEIERKFLLKTLPPDFDQNGGFRIEQGYLATEPHGLQVRLRKKGEKAFLTCKRGLGIVREEHEIELSDVQFETLWPLTAGRRLVKRRHEIPYRGHLVEIDVYERTNQGLIVAEVEFETEAAAAAFIPPGWFAQEISGNPEYSNRNLARE
jgi:CYTH domain-containing protein